MNKRFFLFLIHLPVWVVAILVSCFFGFERHPGPTLVFYFYAFDKFPVPIYVEYLLATFLYLSWSLGSFYFFHSCLVPKYLEKGKTILFAMYSGLFVMIVPVLVWGLAFVFRLTPDNFLDFISRYGFFIWLVWGILTLFCGILGLLYRFSIDWFNNLHVRKEIENVKLQSELQSIKSRLNPHFLFNTLNNIDTLIQTNPAQASAVLSMLSDLFRYVVYETEKEMIEIGKELEIITKYIDLEKIRLANPDAVSFVCAVENDFLIPPMIFIPFIENAFKHSNLNDVNSRLAISLIEKNKELSFHCINSIHTQENNSKEKGIGLQLIIERLKLLYPTNHSLQINRHTDEFEITLKINITHD